MGGLVKRDSVHGEGKQHGFGWRGCMHKLLESNSAIGVIYIDAMPKRYDKEWTSFCDWSILERMQLQFNAIFEDFTAGNISTTSTEGKVI